MAKQYGMVIDTTRCMGCQTCAVACKVSNDVPGELYWAHVEGLDGDLYRPTGHLPEGEDELPSHAVQPLRRAGLRGQLSHRRMAKREDNGAVVVDQEVCIGCGTCVNSCPYEVPQIDEEAGVSSKCTLCFDRLDNDHRPWCVQACPAEARIVGDLNDPESEVSKYIAEKGAQPYMPENGTTPSVYYV